MFARYIDYYRQQVKEFRAHKCFIPIRKIKAGVREADWPVQRHIAKQQERQP